MGEDDVETARVTATRQQTHFAVDSGVAEQLTQIFQLRQRRVLIDADPTSTPDPILDRHDVDAQSHPVYSAEDFHFRSSLLCVGFPLPVQSTVRRISTSGAVYCAEDFHFRYSLLCGEFPRPVQYSVRRISTSGTVYYAEDFHFRYSLLCGGFLLPVQYSVRRISTSGPVHHAEDFHFRSFDVE